MARYLAERFRSLGAEIVFDEAGSRVGGETGNLVARFPGRGEALMLSVHMDTVEPCARRDAGAEGRRLHQRRRDRSSAPTTRPASPN